MDYNEVLQNIDKIHAFGSHPGLQCMKELMDRLGNPQDKLKVVHVAGTNGKGTTCELIASVLTKSGYKTGLYVSPHVSDFRERMQINCEMISKQKLTEVSAKVFDEIEKMNAEKHQVTKFAAVTAIAMLWFAEEKCEIVILEVGLGGRFDATNIIKRPLVSVITSISLDHTKILGDTVEKIAFEKSGIIKEGGTVVVSPKQRPEALKVIKNIAAQHNAELIEAEKMAAISTVYEDLSGTVLSCCATAFKMHFIGDHQVDNAKTAITVLGILSGTYKNINKDSLKKGFACASLPARLEVMSLSPIVIVDGAHNPSGTAALANAVQKYLGGHSTVAVMGMLADKDTDSEVNNLSGVFSNVITVAPSSERAMAAESLAECCKKHGMAAYPSADFDSALLKAFSMLPPNGALIVCGSLYLAGDMRGRIIKLIKK